MKNQIIAVIFHQWPADMDPHKMGRGTITLRNSKNLEYSFHSQINQAQEIADFLGIELIANGKRIPSNMKEE